MARTTQEILERLNAFMESLPTEAKSKCALCNETLTHWVKRAEVETGAGTATVTRMLADKINDGAAPGDRVSDGALRQRVLAAEGSICRKPTNKPAAEPAPTDLGQSVPKESNNDTDNIKEEKGGSQPELSLNYLRLIEAWDRTKKHEKSTFIKDIVSKWLNKKEDGNSIFWKDLMHNQ